MKILGKELTFNDNKVYHAGNKPTASEIGAAAASHTHNWLDIKGTNIINSTANDTTANWGAQANSVHWYDTKGLLNNQPSQYGFLMNFGRNSDTHQLWMTQSGGSIYHRAGNGSGWAHNWRCLLDSDNYKNYTVPKTGGTYTDIVKMEKNTGDSYFVATRTDTGVTVSFGVGAGGTNHGVFSNKLSRWLVYGDSSKTHVPNICVDGKRLSITSSTPSSSATGDIWIQI